MERAKRNETRRCTILVGNTHKLRRRIRCDFYNWRNVFSPHDLCSWLCGVYCYILRVRGNCDVVRLLTSTCRILVGWARRRVNKWLATEDQLSTYGISYSANKSRRRSPPPYGRELLFPRTRVDCITPLISRILGDSLSSGISSLAAVLGKYSAIRMPDFEGMVGEQ
jgi:hypothetical protein